MNNENELKNAIEKRRSRRSYLATPLDEQTLATLQAWIDECNCEGELMIRLIEDGSAAFNGLSKSYGLFSGVRTVLALGCKSGDAHGQEKVGYYGERLMLAATVLGLGTCWVGGTFDRSASLFQLDEGVELAAVITIGRVAEEQTWKEKLVHKIATRSSKTLQELYSAAETVPAWFLRGIEAVQKAPSAQNRQPVRFTYQAGSVRAQVENPQRFERIDLGIAKAHFALAAGGCFALGNPAEFSLNKSLQDK